MAARPRRRAPDPMPATCPIGHGYVVALWSDRPPRVFALPTADKGRTGRPHALEVRIRRRPEDRHNRLACLTVRLTVDGRQVSRSLLRVLAKAVVMRPRSLPASWVLASLDGSCSVGSLRWLESGDAQHLHRGRLTPDVAHNLGRRVALTGAARACCRANDLADEA